MKTTCLSRPLASLLLGTIILGPQAEALDWETAVVLSANTFEARSAGNQAALARASADTAKFPGDPVLTAAPVYHRTSAEAQGEAQGESVSLAAALTWPLGLSEAAGEKADLLAVQASSAAETYRWALVGLENKAYGLYTTAWSAQDSAALQTRELNLLEVEFDVIRAQFTGGSVSYAELRRTEEGLQTARDAALVAERRKRVTRLELFSWLGLADDGQPLQMSRPAPTTLPKAPDLASLALEVDPLILSQKERELLYGQQARQRLKFDGTPAWKVTVTKDGLTGSLGLVGETKNLTAGLEAAVLTLAGKPATTPWALTASVSLTLDSGESDAKAANILLLLAESERLGSESGRAARDLKVRLAYQDWVRAGEAGRQADRNVVLDEETLAAVRAKAKAGELTASEVARAEFDLEESRFLAINKAVESERLLRNAALTAFYIPVPEVNP